MNTESVTDKIIPILTYNIETILKNNKQIGSILGNVSANENIKNWILSNNKFSYEIIDSKNINIKLNQLVNNYYENDKIILEIIGVDESDNESEKIIHEFTIQDVIVPIYTSSNGIINIDSNLPVNTVVENISVNENVTVLKLGNNWDGFEISKNNDKNYDIIIFNDLSNLIVQKELHFRISDTANNSIDRYITINVVDQNPLILYNPIDNNLVIGSKKFTENAGRNTKIGEVLSTKETTWKLVNNENAFRIHEDTTEIRLKVYVENKLESNKIYNLKIIGTDINNNSKEKEYVIKTLATYNPPNNVVRIVRSSTSKLKKERKI